jgi:hypothetical protein
MSYEILPGRPVGQSSQQPGQPEVGQFRQGNDASNWLLRRYLLGHALGTTVIRTVHWFAIAALGAAALLWGGGIKWLAVLVFLFALGLLMVRGALSAVQRRLSGTDQLGAAEPQIRSLIGHTRRGLRAELRRVGLPSAPWGPSLVCLRLGRPRRRQQTVEKLKDIDLSRVVPDNRVDELHLLLRGGPAMRR